MKFKEIIKELNKPKSHTKINKEIQKTLHNVEKSKMWGIFIQNKENYYPKENAVKVFILKKGAENFVKRNKEFKYVVKYFFNK